MKLSLISYMLKDDGQIPIGLLTLAEIARQESLGDIRVLDLPDRHNEDEFIRAIRDSDLVGFSSICSTYNQTIRLCRRLKAANPKIRVLLGGPQASLTAPASLGAFPFIDVIFQGEAEDSWREFLRALKEPNHSLVQVPGIVWRDNEVIRENAPTTIVHDLGTLPLPALDLYDFSQRAAVAPIEIGRGCPFACSFCSTSFFFKRKFRLKPIERILEEMDRLNVLYGSETFYFVQDSFSNSRTFVEKICEALKSHHRSYTWYCSARTDQVSQDLVTRMKDAGCCGIFFGLETGSQRMQQVINKGLNVEQALEVIRWTAELGIEVTTSMIIGFPHELPEDLRDTLRVFLDLKGEGHALVQLHVLAPLPGSVLSREGHELCYDPMPSDFSDTAHVLDSEDRSLIEGHPDIFSNFWHYVNPSIPRERLLFLSHLLTLTSVYFPNTLCLASKQCRDELLDRLLTGPMPAPFYSDSTFSTGLDAGVSLTGELLESFVLGMVPGKALAHALQYDLAYSGTEVSHSPVPTLLHLPANIGEQPGRRIVDGLEKAGELEPYVIQKSESTVEVFRLTEQMYHAVEPFLSEKEKATLPPIEGATPDRDAVDLAKMIDEICASCGECCFEAGGVLCGRDEWPAIRNALVQSAGEDPAATALEESDLLLVEYQRCVEYPQTAEGQRLRARRACPALECRDQRWRCSIEDVKPAGCIAYPLKLILREQTREAEPWWLLLELESMEGREPCLLEKALRDTPGLLDCYQEDLRRKLASRPGAFALAAYNRSRKNHSDGLEIGKFL